MTIVTDERCLEYGQTGHLERAGRVARSLALLREQTELPLAWASPLEVPDRVLLRAHSAAHLERVQSLVGNFDSDTPAYPQIEQHARRSVGGALRALELCRQGEPAFSLLRPPGHHALRENAMGFCYYNSIAVAALEALRQGYSRVAVFDFDVHHGNGTEDILLEHAGVQFHSVHQFPGYPDTGSANVGSNCFNHPLPVGTPREAYLKVLQRTLETLLGWHPEVIAISAGFDAFQHDPIGRQSLMAQDFHWLGQALRASNLPVFSILEGGYSRHLPDLILGYLRGLAGLAALAEPTR